MEVFALWRLPLIEIDHNTAKLGQIFYPLYRKCPLYGESVLERFHCNIFTKYNRSLDTSATYKSIRCMKMNHKLGVSV